MTLLSLDRLSVTYGAAPALAGITLALPRGRRLAVIGESGSGKSTLALAVAGLLPPTATTTGTIAFPALGHAPRPGADIGVLFQDPAASLNPVLPVGEQIAEVLVVHRALPWSAALADAARALDRMRIPNAAARLADYPHQFSGGQAQRIALAAALAADPALLIADEPTSALDPVTSSELATLLNARVAEDGLTLLFITHDLALAAGLADDIAVLHRGRLVEHAPRETLLDHPAHPYSAALLAATLDLNTPRRPRLPEIDPETFAVRQPDA